MIAAAEPCIECGTEVAPGLLSCPGCGRLVHAAALKELAAKAEASEREGDPSAAAAAWRRTLDLLPAGTTQRAAIEQHLKALGAMIDGRAPAAKPASGTGRKVGAAATAGALGTMLLKSKALLVLLLGNGKLLLLGLLKLPTVVSMLLFARWSTGGTAGFSIGLVASIYVHEVGHVAALRRYGIEASAPMFIPGLGALVRLKQYPSDAHEEARTGLAGPLWGLVAALVAAAIGAGWGSPTALSVASFGATINLFNLVPFWQLDGARGMKALSRGQRLGIGAVATLAWAALHQWMPLAIAVLTFARARPADAHPTGDRGVFWLFAALIVAHALLACLPVTHGLLP
jgi:Zn-dependent protease